MGWWIRLFQMCMLGGGVCLFIIMSMQSILWWAGEVTNQGAFTKRNTDASFYYFLDLFFHRAIYVCVACFFVALTFYGWDYLHSQPRPNQIPGQHRRR